MKSIIKCMWLIVLTISSIVAKEASKLEIDEDLMKQSLFYGFIATAAQDKSTSTCRIDLAETADGILKRKRWAIKMLDASGAPSGKLYFGGTYWIGNRVLCELTENPKALLVSNKSGLVYDETSKDVPPFNLAYYAAYFQHHSNIQLTTNLENERRMTWSICLPKSCEGAELSKYLQKYFDSNKFSQKFIYNTNYEVEEVKKLVDDYSWMEETKFKVICGIILASLILCIAGTIFDVYYYQPILKIYEKPVNINNNVFENKNINNNVEKNEYEKNDNLKTENALYQESKKLNVSLGLRLILCFSVYSNNKAIFYKKLDPKSLPSIHGLRIFSMIYVTIGHSILFMQEFFDNRAKTFLLSGDTDVQIFAQAIYGVDSFFCMSGFVLGYGFFTSPDFTDTSRKYKISRKITLFFSALIKRFMRLTPCYMFTLFIADIIANWRFRETPFYTNERNDLICPNYWWRNILYINNLYPRSEMCLSWSWYLSNDMQYFIIGNFILILSSMYFRVAASLYATVFVGSIAYSANLVYRKNYTPLMDELYLQRENFYDNPIVRMGPFLVGIAAGYILYYFKKTLPLKKSVIRLLWTLVFTMHTIIIFGTANRNYTLAGSAAYVSLIKIFWAIGVAWVIIACETGNGGIVNKVLSYRFWLPYSRMSYVAYLVNPILIFLIASFTDTPLTAEISNIVVSTTGYVVLTFFVAYFVTLMIESPNIALTTILFDFLTKKDEKRKSADVKNMSSEKLIPSEKENLNSSDKSILSN